MTRRVWKFEVRLDGPRFELLMPKGAEVLSCQRQDESVCVWALVDPAPKNARETRGFLVVLTGQPIPERLGRFIGTVQFSETPMTWVFHVFEELK
jgi:hypothetical protein